MEFVRNLARKFGPRLSFYRMCVVFYLLLIASIIPWGSIFTFEPSTGGDIGSHFYPIYAMLKSGSLRPWNPGNLAGEPLLVHYFPLPFMMMAGLSLILPAGLVFNWLYILSVLLLPFAVHFYLKKIKTPEFTPEFGFLITVIFIFNTSYFAWGGNIFSTVAGQFCHAYALVFLFLLMGVMHEDLKKKSAISVRGSILVAALILSHAYVALSLPVVALCVLLIAGEADFKKAAKKILLTGLCGVSFTLWWIVPFLTNNAWTTPYESNWLDNLTISSYLPVIFLITTVIGIISVISLLSNERGRELLRKKSLQFILPFSFLSAFYFYLIKIFPLVGLVDIRAIPQVQLFLGLIVSVLLGVWLSLANQRWRKILSGLSLLIVLFLVAFDSRNVATRLRWNWEGWSNKPEFSNFQKINESLKGDFSQPRVAFEQAEVTGMTGTVRAFEMLPYFAGRATTESLYMQATTYAPFAFYFQALLGKQKSCPYPQVVCPDANLSRAIELMPLLGIQDLILATPESKLEADKLNHSLVNHATAGAWTVYRLKTTVPMIETITGKIVPLTTEDWKQEANKYFYSHNKNTPWINVAKFTPHEVNEKLAGSFDQQTNCAPEVRLDWNTIKLKTNCVGVPHVIKVAFHPSFTANSGDKIFLLLPGYMGIIPSTQEVELSFAQTPDWYLSRWFSIFSLLVFFGYLLQRRLTRFQ